MAEEVTQSTLGEVLSRGLTRQLGKGWIYLPETTSLSLSTPCLIVAGPDPETDERGIATAAVAHGFPVEGLDCDTVEDIAVSSQRFADPPPADLLLESFIYYWRFDAFLPAPGAPEPPPLKKSRRRLDREFYDLLGPKTAIIAIVIATFILSSSSTYTALFAKNEKVQQKDNVLKDKDGNVYASKMMSDGKRWMTQNLKIKVTDSYCYDDKQANCDRYGRLYTWDAAKNACNMLGDGWQLPTNDEWRAMAKHYGGVREDSADSGAAAYKALLDGGSSGFNVVLGGGRDTDGKYARLDAHGFYWSATESDTGHSWAYNFGKGSLILNRHSDMEKQRAFSVRCIKP